MKTFNEANSLKFVSSADTVRRRNLNGRLNQEYQLPKTSTQNSGHAKTIYRRPFWLNAPGYYFFASAAAVLFFFLVWAILNEEQEEAPLLIAAFGAVFILSVSVFCREVLLRKTRRQYLAMEKEFRNRAQLMLPPSKLLENGNGKITLEKNARLIKDIQKKSDAARKLKDSADGHLEVLESCREYLTLSGEQMETAGTGSPRLVGFRRGREIVEELHRFHLLSWAENESRALTRKARNYVTISDKINAAQDALAVLNSALEFYPGETRLLESETVLKNFIASIKVSHWVEQAERAAFKGNNKRAISLYRDALFFLAREDVRSEDKEAIAENINAKIASLRETPTNKTLIDKEI